MSRSLWLLLLLLLPGPAWAQTTLTLDDTVIVTLSSYNRTRERITQRCK